MIKHNMPCTYYSTTPADCTFITAIYTERFDLGKMDLCDKAFTLMGVCVLGENIAF